MCVCHAAEESKKDDLGGKMQKDPLVSKVDKTRPQVGNEDLGIGKNSKRIESCCLLLRSTKWMPWMARER